MYQIANKDYKEKQKKLLNRILEHEWKKEAQRLAKEKEQKEKEQRAKEEAERAEAERKKQEAIKLPQEREKREREEKEAKDAFSVFLPESLIELSSDDELSDLELEIEKDEVKELMRTPIKKELVDPDHEKEDTNTKPADEITKMKTGRITRT